LFFYYSRYLIFKIQVRLSQKFTNRTRGSNICLTLFLKSHIREVQIGIRKVVNILGMGEYIEVNVRQFESTNTSRLNLIQLYN
jgi:hypothetical protein